jgi:cell division protein FtsI/penicillin-binding protein 2
LPNKRQFSLRNRFNASSSSILHKTNRLLQIFLCAFLLIGFRIWHLAVMQGEEKMVEALKPRRRTVMQRAHRGMIVDRFGIPIATNRICYRASVETSLFTHIPSVVWRADATGKRQRITPRRDYVQSLSELLGRELGTDPERINDLIHAKASLFPHIPFVIQSHLTEQQYYRLKALERDWPGLTGEIAVERTYPFGKSGCGVLGYLGAISQEEILARAEELRILEQKIAEGNEEEALLQKATELKERAYSLSDWVGKSGIEKQYEHLLRGSSGKKIFEVDHRGTYVRELPGGTAPIAGETVTVSLSMELQQFCEELLMQAEKTREGRSLGVDPETKERVVLKQPWIKGGSIVVLEPRTGEVLALASIPRFDPNDFVQRKQVHRWQETDQWVGDLWDGVELLYREREGQETVPVTWERYLQELLPAKGLSWMQRMDHVKTAIQIQEDFETLLYLTQANPVQVWERELSLSEEAASLRRRFEALFPSIPQVQDRLFLLDLLRLAVYAPAFSDELIAKLGSLSIGKHRALTQAFQRVERAMRAQNRDLFHMLTFRAWREAHQKEFLREKRLEEKERHSYARPYIDYLDRKEQQLFEEFWTSARFSLLAAQLKQTSEGLPSELLPYFEVNIPQESDDWRLLQTIAVSLSVEESEQWLRTMRSYQDLHRPLWSHSPFLRTGAQTERDLAAAFYPRRGFGFCRSHSYQNAAPLGSLFKLVTAYEVLQQRGGALPPLTIFDEVHFDEKSRSLIVGLTTDRKPLYRHYKGGRLPRSHSMNLGKVDLIGALEQSSNPYFSLLASDFLSDPEDLNRAAASFGFGEKSGLDLPSECAGRLPTDLRSNRTGLYSFAIGQHTLLATPLQAARFLSSLANGGHLIEPKLLQSAPSRERMLPLSLSIRNTLFEGMDRVLWGSKGNARPSVIRGLTGNPLLVRQFLTLQHQMIGKSSTAEVLCRTDAHPSALPRMYKHIWFGAIAFAQEQRWSMPELVVVVQLLYGDGGKEAAPLAAQVIHKWREIRDAHCSK